MDRQGKILDIRKPAAAARRLVLRFMAALFLFAAIIAPTKYNQAYALCTLGGTMTAAESTFNASINAWKDTFFSVFKHTLGEVTGQKIFLISMVWEDNVLPAMLMMSEQLTAVSLKQTQIFGAFLDAKHQMETQQTLQKIQARSHKDYHPSVGMCEIGTGIKSLALSESRAEYTASVLNKRSQDRNLGSAYTVARQGQASELRPRMAQYVAKFCDPSDNNNALSALCPEGPEDPKRMNKDIDFVRTFSFPWTLQVDFTNPELNPHEEEILALATNLYGNVLVSPGTLEPRDDGTATTEQERYLEARSLIAKRSVAENSFNAIMGLKAEGSPGSREYIQEILKRLGLDEKESISLLYGEESWKDEEGEEIDPENYKKAVSPSYYAQMEILTKKMLQHPGFYTNLYDKPANVDRKGVALQAIGLMQKFDLFKSYLRQEAITAVLLESALMKEQSDVENVINSIPAFSGGLSTQ